MRAFLFGALGATLLGCTCLSPPQMSMHGCADPTGFCSDWTAAGPSIDPEAESKNNPGTRLTQSIATKTSRLSDKFGDNTKASIRKTKTVLPKAEDRPSDQLNDKAGPVVKAANIAAMSESASSAELGDKVEAPIETPKTVAAKNGPSPPAELETKVEPALKTATIIPAKGASTRSALRADNSDPVISQARRVVASKMENPESVEFREMTRAVRTNTLGKPIDSICGYVKGKRESGEEIEEMAFLYVVQEDEAYIVDGSVGNLAAIAYQEICK